MSEPQHIREIIAEVLPRLLNPPPQEYVAELSWQQPKTALDEIGVPFSAHADEAEE